MTKRILFVIPYPLDKAPSQRFRVEQFFPALEEHHISYIVAPFLDDKTWAVLYQQSGLLKKGWGVLKGFLKRFALLFKATKYSHVFVHREASPIGPPVFEFLLAKVLRKKLIYDFDDAIWMVNTVTPSPLVDMIRSVWKIRYICKWSYKVVGGNAYLCNYASKYNRNVVLIPTSVDTCKKFASVKTHSNEKKLVIGWTGSHTTMTYLDMIYPVIRKLEEKYDFTFLVISNKAPEAELRSLRFLPWKKDTEIEDLSKIDIGIMPMFRDPFSEGKCGFKIIQYLSMGIPALATPVGVNATIIEEDRNGFLCEDEQEWYQKLSLLLEDADMRQRMGMNGRKKIEEQFSIKANTEAFINLFS
jgi:glycosyltransferase involved in cell wall biosynthesis